MCDQLYHSQSRVCCMHCTIVSQPFVVGDQSVNRRTRASLRFVDVLHSLCRGPLWWGTGWS